jgi:signal transduction histidine kinase
MQPERIKIAQELHDGIAQDLIALSYSLDLLLAEPNTPANTRIEIRKILFKVSTIIESVRKEIFNLRASELISLEETMRNVASEMHSLVELRIFEDNCEISSQLREELIAISAELLRNSIKHSGASVIEISIKRSEDGGRYTFSDNGKGIDPLSTAGFGIRGIQERCSSIGSELIMTSTSQGINYVINLST